MDNVITKDEFYQFRQLPVRKKVDSMVAYLIGVNGRKYNMKKVGAAVFGDENYSFTVSLIHRCYNFSGKNSGKYSPGCKFERTYGYRVTRNDIEAFVKKYPNGTFNTGITFEDFLKTKVNSSETQRSNPSQFNVPNNSYNYVDNEEYDGKTTLVLIGIGIAGILTLLILLFTGNLLKYWIISLLALFFAIGAYGSFAILQDGGQQGTLGSLEEDEYLDHQGYDDDYIDYKSYANAPRSRSAAKAPKMRKPAGNDFNIIDRLSGKSLSSILTNILVFVLIANIFISAVITHEPISTRFWALYIAVATTKGMIFGAKEFSIMGKAIILGIVWLTASNFM